MEIKIENLKTYADLKPGATLIASRWAIEGIAPLPFALDRLDWHQCYVTHAPGQYDYRAVWTSEAVTK